MNFSSRTGLISFLAVLILSLGTCSGGQELGGENLVAQESSPIDSLSDAPEDSYSEAYDIKEVDPLLAELDDFDLESEGSNYVPQSYPPKNVGYNRPPPPPQQYPGRRVYSNPYKVLPGTYSRESYGGPRYSGSGRYDRHQVYNAYLSSQSYMDYSKKCLKSYGQSPRLSPKDLSAAFQYALHEIRESDKYEASQYQAGNYFNSSEYSLAARHQVPTYSNNMAEPIHKKEKQALFNEYASKFLMHHYCLSKLQAQYLLPSIKIGPSTGNPYNDNSCYAAYGSSAHKLYCTDSKYRTFDGSCNNLYNPYWGKAFVCHLRLVPAAYEDGIEKPKTYSYTGALLPNPRLISTAAHSPRPDRSYYTHLKMGWGQWVNHDLTNTAVSTANYKGGAIKCCPTPHHPQCLPIQLGPNDYYQGRYKKTCMNFVRSAPCPLCNLGPREQENVATSFLDLSTVYGSSRSDSIRLRTYQGGYLKSQRNKCGRDILPVTSTPWQDQCSAPYRNMLCFDAGDPRVNQHPGLMVLHTLFMRLHNYHAKNLHQTNPRWDDDRLFHEARKITIAQYQHIVYHEYLPIVFGPHLLKYYDLDVNYGTGYTRYEPYTDPTIWNDYVIAGRYGHSQISSFFSLMGYGYNGTKAGYWIRDHFFDPKFLYECSNDAIIQGYLTDPSMSVDPWVDGDLHNYLYRVKGEPVGSDLAAFNIQRSRDHGIPPYYVYLDFCFGFKARSWDDLAKFIPWEELSVLKSLYKDFRDVELWPASISERKFPDADIGPTAACIVGIQFYHLKFGDRYFYSHGYQTGSFTPLQLSNLKRVTTLSNFLCKTSDYLPSVQKYAFFPPSGYNPQIPCQSVPDIDYKLWREY